MKRALVIAILFLTVSVVSAWAHPPSDIKITFDPKTKVLTAVVMHDVKNPMKHYISKVDVGLNGKEILSQAISRQDNTDNQTVSYLIADAKSGDTLSVEAYCSIAGKLEEEITVGDKITKAK